MLKTVVAEYRQNYTMCRVVCYCGIIFIAGAVLCDVYENEKKEDKSDTGILEAAITLEDPESIIENTMLPLSTIPNEDHTPELFLPIVPEGLNEVDDNAKPEDNMLFEDMQVEQIAPILPTVPVEEAAQTGGDVIEIIPNYVYGTVNIAGKVSVAGKTTDTGDFVTLSGPVTAIGEEVSSVPIKDVLPSTVKVCGKMLASGSVSVAGRSGMHFGANGGKPLFFTSSPCPQPAWVTSTFWPATVYPCYTLPVYNGFY